MTCPKDIIYGLTILYEKRSWTELSDDVIWKLKSKNVMLLKSTKNVAPVASAVTNVSLVRTAKKPVGYGD